MEQEESEEQQGVFSNKPMEGSTDKNSNHTNDSEVTREISATFDFTEKTWKTDFTLVVEDTRFHVSKIVLALASPVFDRMFQGDFKESDTDELELPGKRLEDVTDFLRTFYPSVMSKPSKEEALRVLPLAEEYQVLHLKRRCEEILLGCIDEFIPAEELFRIMKAASLYDLKECLKKAVTVASERSKEDIDAAAREIVLPAEPLKEIYQSLSDRLSNRNNELESWNSRLTAKLAVCETMRNCLSNRLEKVKRMELDESLVWTRKTFMFIMDINDEKPVEDIVSISEIELNAKFYIDTYQRIYASFRNNEDNDTECSFNVQIVIVNKLSTDKHSVVQKSFKFCRGKQNEKFNVASMGEIEDPRKGFVSEGNLLLEANIFMTMPKQLQTQNSTR